MMYTRSLYLRQPSQMTYIHTALHDVHYSHRDPQQLSSNHNTCCLTVHESFINECQLVLESGLKSTFS